MSKKLLLALPIAVLIAVSTPAQPTTDQVVSSAQPVTQPITPVVESVSTPDPQVSQSVEPVTYKWADEMSQAGIDPSDYGYVTQMLLDDNGWRTTGYPLWQRANPAKPTLVENLAFANSYVVKYYGDWQTANALYVGANNF